MDKLFLEGKDPLAILDDEHDCHLSPEDGCDHFSHKEQPEP